ncbi:MAG TPA: flagellar biosynthetic protein FliO [Herbaspirillum sp.]|jgi:flagellar protein FliO/FliZ|nr:flagellar biosynthetic protein FliO [Herbaspirillum sp.]
MKRFALLLASAWPALALADTATTATASAPKTANALHTIASSPPVPSAGSSSLSMLFGLALVLGLIVCLAWLFKRSGLAPAMNASAAAKVVGGVSVGNRERIVVVEVGDQWIVVGVAPGRVTALSTMSKQESVPVNTPPLAKNFASWMKQTIEKRNGPR